MQIEIYLKLNKTIGEIAKLLGKSTSTISREIKKYRMLVLNNKQIMLKKRTDEQIINQHPCHKIQNKPYVCNGCELKNRCHNHYVMYMPEIAHKKYLEIKSNSNKTLKDLSKYKFLDKIQKRLDKGQTLVHIVYSLKEKYDDMVSLTTLYNWIKEEKNF